MKASFAVLIFLTLCSCNLKTTDKKENPSHTDFSAVVDSISLLMSQYHYNPQELTSDEYQAQEKKMKDLAKNARDQKEFIHGFNAFWAEGPFSHVRLDMAERPAGEMADFIDTLRVGDHSVSLEWIDGTAVLSVTTMTGVDTKERIFEAYREIHEKEPESLIIDLRNNTGGTFAGIPLLGHILLDSLDAGMFVSRKWWNDNTLAPTEDDIENLEPWHGWSIKSFWNDVQAQPLTRVKFGPMEPHFDGQVYVLISQKSASAAEFTADALTGVKNVTLIGATTAGEMLSQKMFDLPNGFQLSLPIAEYYSTRMGRIEGKGVEPDITIDQSVAMEVAMSLIRGETVEDAVEKAELTASKLMKQPFEGESIYLFGNMNDWGKKWNITPKFEYKGQAIFEAKTTLEKGRYEFKIAPMDWSFDYGATGDQENIKIGTETSLVRVKGSDNLVIELPEKTALTFRFDARNESKATLSVLR